ncbi:SGNH/GDSL hydrolase family protein [Spirosoma foliorum]|uniref:SGNH/GDSL hydrolase family protein n=1 Tax=Spirosoma foliorum TaxID=2710596 RepID=A0A7G5GZE4_9BACT|nr:SGNH/GDSL hydrolase family protein [Spirosoma foliorum]QMW04236.1 SGNH/GDSL hydrolase family protein [Spirosoma foliorum]
MPPKTSRRSFLQSSVVAGFASGLPSHSLLTNQSVQPPKEKGLVFLFQGDSITDGNRGRNTDPNHIMGHGYAFSIASRIGADFPEEGFLFYNRGISGNKITDLQKRWQTDTLDLKPDVLSVLVGINDTNAIVNKSAEAISLEEFETIYRTLLTDSKKQNPATLFVLGIPFVYPVGKRKENWELWRDDTAKRQVIVRKLAAEFDAVLVDYPALVDKAITKAPIEYWIWDGIHPTVFTHELMAREWIKQVSARLKFLKKYRY